MEADPIMVHIVQSFLAVLSFEDEKNFAALEPLTKPDYRTFS